MKIILIDIGNSSHCKVALSDGKRIVSVSRVMRSSLSGEVERLAGPGCEADVICVSSVARPDADLDAWLRGHCLKYIQVDAFASLPLRVEYGTPETLGADRIAAAIGASVLFPGKDCIIFDFGTALTVDFVDRTGTFKGGNISPGMSMRFQAIHEHTGRLPLVSAECPRHKAGQNTSEAINNGVVLGIMFEVESYINRNPGSIVIFTGGDALFFAKMLKTPIFVVYNLVLIGLSKIAQFNV